MAEDDETVPLPPAGGDTVPLPASGEADAGPERTDGPPSATVWSGRARVPVGEPAEPAEEWPVTDPGGGRWWLPMLVGAVAVLLLGVLGVGVWLIVQALGEPRSPVVPAASPSPSPSGSATASPTPSAAPTRDDPAPTASPGPDPSPDPSPSPAASPSPAESESPEPSPSPEPSVPADRPEPSAPEPTSDARARSRAP